MPALDFTPLALFAQKCPCCHWSKLFTHRMYDLAHFTNMPAACPVCRLAFEPEPEPGFYFGAMYINYIFSTAIVLVVGLLVSYGFGSPDT